jgi:hypothetical protein
MCSPKQLSSYIRIIEDNLVQKLIDLLSYDNWEDVFQVLMLI